MKQRVIYDAVTGIRADYLEQAADCVDRSAGSRRRLRYAAVCCGVLLCAGFGLLRHLTQSPELPQTAPENAGMTQNTEASVSTQTVGAPGTSAVTQTAAGEGSSIWTPFRRTVNADPDKDSFGEDQIHSVDVIWEGRRYDQLPAELYAQYGIAPEVRESELGALIGTVAEIGPGLPDAKLGAQEPTLAGAEVRAYLPAQSRAVIAVQKGGQYSIFVFRGFAGDFAQTLAFYGCRRDNNLGMFRAMGPDTGFDCVDNYAPSAQTAAFLGALEDAGSLPKTILYSLNTNDNAAIDTILGCFQNDTAVGRIQHGSAWWFNDHFDGMSDQLKSLASLGYLAGFVGMLTDSRSFLSYPRHEYFRRILCRIFGEWVEEGFYPEDFDTLKEIVADISYNNAKRYFAFSSKST